MKKKKEVKLEKRGKAILKDADNSSFAPLILQNSMNFDSCQKSKRFLKSRESHKNQGKIYDFHYILYIFARYLILVVFGIFLPVFYKLFLPLTIWPVYFLLNIFYNTSIIGNIIFVSGAKIEIVNACVAGSAYYLLLILNLTTSMKAKQRIFSLLFSFFSLLIVNILRIFFFSILYIENFAFFDITHKLFWYALSTLFVVGIWFLTAWLFKIKNVPVYSDTKSFIA